MLLTTSNFLCLVAGFAVVAFLNWTYIRFFSLHGLPKDIPWANGSRDTWSTAKLRWSSFFGLRDVIRMGYNNFSKKGKVFILPNIVTGPEVILPMSQMKWLLEQPDYVLSQNEVNREFLHADRTMLHPRIIHDNVHGRVIKGEMTKGLDDFADGIVEEIEQALSLNWGTDTSHWKTIRVYDTLLDVIARISNRALVGVPLCRNAEYLQASKSFNRSVVMTAGALNLLPHFLQPILSRGILAYDRMLYRRMVKHIAPVIESRRPQFKVNYEKKKPDYSQHHDYVQWAMTDAYSQPDPNERTTKLLTSRLAVLSFAAIQSSVITATNAIFDIASSPDCQDIQSALRTEVETVRNATQGQGWSRTVLSKMVKVDSVFRESMRLWGFISRGVMKKVVAANGVTLPDGHHLKQGSKVGVTAYAIHHDESVYHEAEKFSAFRFCKDWADGVSNGAGANAMVVSSDNFMAFSHGRHACPGRHFAANQLKLLLAAIVQKYDIAPIAERPVNHWLNNTIGPPIWETLRVRRRRGTFDDSKTHTSQLQHESAHSIPVEQEVHTEV